MIGDREVAEEIAKKAIGPNYQKTEFSSLLEALTHAALQGIICERKRIQAVMEDVAKGSDALIERWNEATKQTDPDDKRAFMPETT